MCLRASEYISDVMQTYYDIELKDDHYAIATSTGPEKFSAHIVLKNYAVFNNREATHLTKKLIDDHLPEFLWPIVDAGVNKSIQNFRMLYSHKCCSHPWSTVLFFMPWALRPQPQ